MRRVKRNGLKPGLVGRILGDEIDEAAVIDRRDAFEQAIRHAARIEVGAEHIDLHAGHGGGDFGSGGIAARCGIDGILGQQQGAALGCAQAGIQRIALEGDLLTMCSMSFSLRS
jgi:hypothetical protein